MCERIAVIKWRRGSEDGVAFCGDDASTLRRKESELKSLKGVKCWDLVRPKKHPWEPNSAGISEIITWLALCMTPGELVQILFTIQCVLFLYHLQNL